MTTPRPTEMACPSCLGDGGEPFVLTLAACWVCEGEGHITRDMVVRRELCASGIPEWWLWGEEEESVT